jgi:hypothetical protein
MVDRQAASSLGTARSHHRMRRQEELLASMVAAPIR